MPLMLCYDTETSGLPLWHDPSSDPRQPHIVQLACALVDLESRKSLASLNLVARVEDWEIDEGSQRTHGITPEWSRQVGVSERSIVSAFIQLWRLADFRVAHSETFDMRIVRIALSRYEGICDPDVWKAGKAKCTQRLAQPICKLPPTDKMLRAGRKSPKAPNLAEAYRFFTGREMQGAHSALGDLRACLAVWWAIQDHDGQGTAAAASPVKAPTAPARAPAPAAIETPAAAAIVPTPAASAMSSEGFF